VSGRTAVRAEARIGPLFGAAGNADLHRGESMPQGYP
jgi:hypothetical protein